MIRKLCIRRWLEAPGFLGSESLKLDFFYLSDLFKISREMYITMFYYLLVFL